MKTKLLLFVLASTLSACSSDETKFHAAIDKSASNGIAAATFTIKDEQGLLEVEYLSGIPAIYEDLRIKKDFNKYNISFEEGGALIAVLEPDATFSNRYVCVNCIHFGKNNSVPLIWFKE